MWNGASMLTRWVARAAVLAAVLGGLGGVRGENSTADSPPPVSAERWDWPISPPRLTAAFEAPPTPYAAGHRGVDLAATPGQAVVAPTAGILSVAQVVVDRPVVTIKVGEHLLVSMEPVDASIPLGSAVAPGQPVGVIAAGGHCDGACVHLGVRVDGEYVSPLLFLAAVPPAVLLPVE